MEDIHGLFSLSKKPPKPQLMANYYHKVSTVFWKSGNALFHASTLHRLYHLSREMRKNLTQEEMQRWEKSMAWSNFVFGIINSSFEFPFSYIQYYFSGLYKTTVEFFLLCSLHIPNIAQEGPKR